MPQDFQNAKARAGDGLIRFRVRNASSTGGQAETSVVSPYTGRIRMVMYVNEGNISSDWVANITTPNGTLTGAIDTSDPGHASIAGSEAVYNNIDQSDDAAQVHAGDAIVIATTSGNGSATSIYGWLYVG